MTHALPGRALFGYGLAAAPVMYAYVLVLIMYMKYAVDDLGAEPAAIGSIFFFAKLWDAISDPAVGNLSDRTVHSSGRRRPWLRAAAPLMALFSIMAWAPPSGLDETVLILWIAVSVVGFYTAFTIFEVPHMALGAEMTLDTTERNRVFGVRQVMRVLGMLTAGTLGTYLVGQGVATTTAMAYALGFLIVLLVLTGVSMLPAERVEYKGRGGTSPWSAVRDVAANRHARLLLFVVFIDSIGAGGIGVLTPFVIEYVLKMDGLVPYMLGANMLATLTSIPVWLWLGRSFEKRRLLLVSMVGSAVGYGSLMLLGAGDWPLMAFSAVTAGAASSCANTLGYTLKSEIVDCDEHATGERKEGVYFAGWSFMSKLAAGIMIGLVGFGLQWSGFQPNVPDQTEIVQRTMIVLMGGFPFVCYLIGAIAFSRFSLNESEHSRIRAELDARAEASRAAIRREDGTLRDA